MSHNHMGYNGRHRLNVHFQVHEDVQIPHGTNSHVAHVVCLG